MSLQWVRLVDGPCAGRWVREPGGQGFLPAQTELWASATTRGGVVPRRWFQYVYDAAGGQWQAGGAQPRTALPREDWEGVDVA